MCQFVKMTLWGNYTDSIPESGTYKIKDVRINSFNGKYLTTTNGTVIKSSETKIVNHNHAIEEDVLEDIFFPADTINLFEENFYCKKCQRKAVPTGHFLCCDACGSKSLLSKCDHRYDVRATFIKPDDSKVSLIIPHQVFIELAKMLDIAASNQEDIQVAMLTSSNIKASFHTRNNVIQSIEIVKK